MLALIQFNILILYSVLKFIHLSVLVLIVVNACCSGYNASIVHTLKIVLCY